MNYMNKLNFISHLRPPPPHIIFTATPLLMNDVYTVRCSTSLDTR